MSLEKTLPQERQSVRPGQTLLVATLCGPSKWVPVWAVAFTVLGVITGSRLPGLLENAEGKTMYYVLIALAGAAALSYVWLTAVGVRYMLAVKRIPGGDKRSLEDALILQGRLRRPAITAILLNAIFFLM